MKYGSGTHGVLGVALSLTVLASVWAPVSSVASPGPEELVPNTVARISDAANRDDEIVTRAEFRHALVLVATPERRPAIPRPGDEEYEALKRGAMVGLLETIWVRGEAAEMGIVITPRQVQRMRAQIVRENFESAAEFRKFLRGSRLTRRDVYERVELQLLASRIQQRIAAGAGSDAEEQEAFEQFLDEFNEKWRARTVCAPKYEIALCSNG